ncbi:hypothetical protein CAEBREN_32574 [Caenorhabditis brenneri]|uniref:BTB domain-containing protein n=1 Tax=Caenorhabditis brenneri TaxID=135651 RepID=G0PEB0_CAEBE|nr:hypothetical protein CAEBREN_32574 [Caenorhabditis brenneri]
MNMFWRSNNDQVKRMANFYPKGLKMDFCSIPALASSKEVQKLDLGYCGNTKWFLGVDNRKSDKLSISLTCEPAQSCLAHMENWAVHADVTVRFVNQKAHEKSLTASEFDVQFDRKDKEGHNWKHTFEKVTMNEKSGFYMNGTAMFQVHIGITKVEELYSGDFVDLSVPREGESDMVLVVGDKKLHVSKQILSINSPFFQALFNGSFNESGMSEIPINNVDLNAFHIFLQYIYMAPIEICEENVSQLLLMGDQFVVKKLKRECENFLLRKDINQEDAMELAIFHSLDRVLCHKIKDKSVEELTIWRSLGKPLPPNAKELLDKILVDVPAPEKKEEPEPEETPVESESSTSTESTEVSSTSSSSTTGTDSDA